MRKEKVCYYYVYCKLQNVFYDKFVRNESSFIREIDKISIIHVIVKLRTDGLILFKKKQRKKDIPIICSDTVYFCSFQRFQVNATSVCVCEREKERTVRIFIILDFIRVLLGVGAIAYY